MRKLLYAGLISLLVLAFAGCSGEPPEDVSTSPETSVGEVEEPAAPPVEEAVVDEPEEAEEEPEADELEQYGIILPEEDDGMRELVDTVIGNDGAHVFEVAVAIQERGAEALPFLLAKVFTAPADQQGQYLHLLVRINSEPDRFDALKKLIEMHPDPIIRTRSVESLTRAHHPEEAVEFTIELTKNEETTIRSTAYRAMRFAVLPGRYAEVCETLRKGLNDPEQAVRIQAQNSLDYITDQRGIECP